MPRFDSVSPLNSSQRPALDALTSLRFFAAFVVLFVHALELATGKKTGLDMLSANAVSFFFVLSGFILTYVYAHRLTWEELPTFYRARWARIWPLHIVCLLAGFGIQAASGIITVDGHSIRQVATYVPLAQSWIPIENWAYQFNGPSWSLSTEMAFYLVFPFMLWATVRRPLLLAVSVGLGSMLLLAWTEWHWSSVANASRIQYCMYVHPAFRMFDFVMGLLFGVFFLNRPTEHDAPRGRWSSTLSQTLAVGITVVCIWAVSRWGPISRTLTNYDLVFVDGWFKRGAGCAAAFGWLIVCFSAADGFLSRLLEHPIFIYLGRISFAVYVVQYPVIDALRSTGVTAFLPTVGMVGLTIVLCLIAAAILQKTIETPCRKWMMRSVPATSP